LLRVINTSDPRRVCGQRPARPGPNHQPTAGADEAHGEPEQHQGCECPPSNPAVEKLHRSGRPAAGWGDRRPAARRLSWLASCFFWRGGNPWAKTPLASPIALRLTEWAQRLGGQQAGEFLTRVPAGEDPAWPQLRLRTPHRGWPSQAGASAQSRLVGPAGNWAKGLGGAAVPGTSPDPVPRSLATRAASGDSSEAVDPARPDESTDKARAAGLGGRATRPARTDHPVCWPCGVLVADPAAELRGQAALATDKPRAWILHQHGCSDPAGGQKPADGCWSSKVVP